MNIPGVGVGNIRVIFAVYLLYIMNIPSEYFGQCPVLPATPTDKDLNVAYREINSKRRRSSSEQIKSRTGGFDYIQLSANADINTGSTPDHFAAWTPNKTVVRLSKIMLSKKITR